MSREKLLDDQKMKEIAQKRRPSANLVKSFINTAKNSKTLNIPIQKSKKLTASMIHNKNLARLSMDNEERNQIFVDLMRRHNRLYKEWMRYDLASAFFTFLGLVFALVEYELGFKNDINADRDVHVIERSIVRLIMIGTWAFSVLFLLMRYKIKRKWQNLEIPKEIINRVYNNDYTNAMRKNRRKGYFSFNLLFDLVILTVQPIPFVDWGITMEVYSTDGKTFIYPTYLISDFLLLFMFLRIYIVIRNVFNHSLYSDPYAKLHCERYGFTANTRWVYRCYLLLYPGPTVVITLFSSIILFSFLIRISDRPAQLEVENFRFDSFFNNMYFVIATITTVGYGDFTCVSAIGKFVSMLASFWGAFIMSLLIVTVGGILSLNKKETKAFYNLRLVKKAARSVVAAMKLRVIQKKHKRNRKKDEDEDPNINKDKQNMGKSKIRQKAQKLLVKRLSKFKEVSSYIKKMDEEKDDPVEILGMELIQINVKMAKMNEVILSCYQMLKSQRAYESSPRASTFKIIEKDNQLSPKSENEVFIPSFGGEMQKIDEEEFEEQDRSPRERMTQLQRLTTEDRADEYDQWLKINMNKVKGKKGNIKEVIKNKDKFFNKLETENRDRKSFTPMGEGSNDRIQNFSDFFEQRAGDKRGTNKSDPEE